MILIDLVEEKKEKRQKKKKKIQQNSTKCKKHLQNGTNLSKVKCEGGCGERRKKEKNPIKFNEMFTKWK